MNKTGFFRVTFAKRGNNKYFKYQIRNELVKKEIMARDIMELKNKVQGYGFLWGITDRIKAEENSQQYKLKALQGDYGIQIEE